MNVLSTIFVPRPPHSDPESYTKSIPSTHTDIFNYDEACPCSLTNRSWRYCVAGGLGSTRYWGLLPSFLPATFRCDKLTVNLGGTDTLRAEETSADESYLPMRARADETSADESYLPMKGRTEQTSADESYLPMKTRGKESSADESYLPMKRAEEANADESYLPMRH